MSRTAVVLRSIAAPILGYAVIVVGTSISFKLAGGINLRSPLPNFILGTIGIIASGLLGGVTAGIVGGRKPVWHATSVLILLIMDSATVLFFRKRPDLDPLWFGITSATGLMLATVAGGVLFQVMHRRPAFGRWQAKGMLDGRKLDANVPLQDTSRTRRR